MIWHALFVEGYAQDLAQALNQITAAGGLVRYVLTNGVNRWTIIWILE